MITFTDGLSSIKATAMLLVLLALPFAASAADSISKKAQAHIACYALLDMIFDDFGGGPRTPDAFPDALGDQRIEHERRYIEIGLDDLESRQDTWVRNGLLYRLGKFAQEMEDLERARIYCDDPNVRECPAGELKWRTVEQIERAAFRSYQRRNCEFLE